MSPQVQRIEFCSANPYEARFPNIRVVDRETLHIIKSLRSAGYEVVVKPDDGAPLYYLTEKGFKEFLQDPVSSFWLTTSIEVVLNAIAIALSKYFSSTGAAPPQNVQVVRLIIEVEQHGNRVAYDEQGNSLSREFLEGVRGRRAALTAELAALDAVTPPDPLRPVPLHLEHTSKIIGWAETVQRDEIGIRIENMVLTDPETEQRVLNGELTGLSFAGLVERSTCMVCQSNYADCNHITGEIYGGVACVVRIDRVIPVDFSVVRDPVNPNCRIQL